jgi:hypothetical protein
MSKFFLRFISILLVPCLLADQETVLAAVFSAAKPSAIVKQEDWLTQAVNPFSLWVGPSKIERDITGKDRNAIGLPKVDPSQPPNRRSIARQYPKPWRILYVVWRSFGGFAIGYWTAMHVARPPGIINLIFHPFDLDAIFHGFLLSIPILMLSYSLHFLGHVLVGRLAGARSRMTKEGDVFEGGTDIQHIAHLLGGPGINLLIAGFAWQLAHFDPSIFPNLFYNVLNEFLSWNLTMGIGALAPLWPNVGGLLILQLTWRVIRNSWSRSKLQATANASYNLRWAV